MRPRPSFDGAARRRRLPAPWCAGLVLALVVARASTSRADRTDDAWRQGNDAFLRGDYTSAIAVYEQLERQQVTSPDLYFNLGDAYFRKGQLGRAIWAWERALTLDPDDEDARFNLEQARQAAARRVEDQIQGADREPAWIRLVNLLSPATESWLFVVLYLGFFAALSLFLRARRRRSLASAAAGGDSNGAIDGARGSSAALESAAATSSALWGVVTGLLAAAALGAGVLLAGRFVLDRAPFAIVLPDANPAKEGADVNYRTLFTVHAGLRVRVLEEDHDWVRIRLANGLEGWVPSQSVGRL